MHCHNRVFGLYCELHILHEVYNVDYPFDKRRIEELYHDRYNDALQLRIYEQTTTLDVTPTVYALPQWICENSVMDCVEYIN
jgi:hypothetical protein